MERIITDTKRCNRCRESLPYTAFNPGRFGQRDGLHGHCKECEAIVAGQLAEAEAERTARKVEKVESRTDAERERLRLRNLEYRRNYLARKKAREEGHDPGPRPKRGPKPKDALYVRGVRVADLPAYVVIS